MPAPSNDALKREVEAIFGQTLNDEQIEASKGRLPTMLHTVHLLGEWGGKLGTIGPAQIQHVVETPSDD